MNLEVRWLHKTQTVISCAFGEQTLPLALHVSRDRKPVI